MNRGRMRNVFIKRAIFEKSTNISIQNQSQTILGARPLFLKNTWNSPLFFFVAIHPYGLDTFAFRLVDVCALTSSFGGHTLNSFATMAERGKDFLKMYPKSQKMSLSYSENRLGHDDVSKWIKPRRQQC